MDSALLQEVATHFLSRDTFEEDVVRHNHCGSPINLQKREDVLHEVELLVARRRPEVLAYDDLVIFLRVPLLVHKEQALLFAKGWIREDHRVFRCPGRCETVMS